RHHRPALLAHRGRPRAGLRPPRDPLAGAHPARRVDRRDPGESPAAHRPAGRGRDGRADAHRHPRDPHRSPDDPARAGRRPRVRRALGDARGRSRGDRARVPRLRQRRRQSADRSRRGGGGMTRVGWRQQRTEAVITALVLVLLAVLLVPTGIQMAHAYHHDGLAACARADPSYDCGSAIDAFHSRFGTVAGLINWFTLLPGLFGILLAAPFLIDLENGTYRLAWTQSIRRSRW